MKKFQTTAAALLAIASFAAAQDAVQPAASPKPAQTAETERVVVVGGAIEQSETDKAQSVTILNENNLKQKAGPTLGDTLSNEPGVAGSGFSAGASRPIIRGQADNRIRVLNNGTEVFDVSNLSPDHAPSVSALLSQSIEVVRGPATILFGSGAIGGVVNVTDNVIPVEQPPTALSGEVDGRFDSANLERTGAIALTLSPAKHWVFHAQVLVSRTDDRSIPGFALDERIRATLTPVQLANNGFGGNPFETVPNTYVKTKDYAIGGSYVWDKGYVGASFTEFLSVYGVPDDPEVDDPTVPPDRVRLDVDKRQVNVRSSIVDPFPWFSTVNAKFVYTDYRHDEIDGQTIGSTFLTNGVDSRLELVHKPIGLFDGSIGGQFFYKELSVLGDESFLQPSQTTEIAAFIFEELKLNNQVRLQFGARIEYQTIHIDSSDPGLTSLTSPDQQDQNFLPVSGAAGILYDFAEGWQVAVNGTYSQRAPTAEELFARGPHDATFQFIIGNPTLSVEKNVGIDVSLRKTAGAVTGSISAFYNHYDGFIDFAPTGAVEDGLQVFVYTPKTAEFYGAEARADFHLLPLTLTKMRDEDAKDAKSVKNFVTGEQSESQKNPNDLYLRVQGDYVHATDLDTGEPLPRITPLRFSISLNYETEKWNASIEGQRVAEQDRVAPFETSTPGYTFLNATVGYKFQVGPTHNYVYVRGNNLTDAEARDHLSFLKEVLPLAGRGVVVGFRTTF
jgi:iron complex outermembrane receptor protein